jgi:hypothetical protein
VFSQILSAIIDKPTPGVSEYNIWIFVKYRDTSLQEVSMTEVIVECPLEIIGAG